MRKDIEKLYFNFEKLNDDFKDLEETRKAGEEFLNYMEINNIIGNVGVSKRKLEIEELLNECQRQSEKRGFIYGFEYAVRLLTNQKGGAEA